MFRRFRQHGFALSSSLAGLLLASLLLAAMAPCLADSQVNIRAASPGMAVHGNAMSKMGGMEMAGMDGDCPHCDSAVSTSCMESAVDCGEQPAIFSPAPEPEKTFAVSLKAIEPPPVARVVTTPNYPPSRLCDLSGRDRLVMFCTFQE